ncbi:hypothetical protein ACFL96_06290 [Thermoproteota archaeon]
MKDQRDLSDHMRYELFQEKQLEDWETICLDCGACCGIVEGDPCQHLVVLNDSKCRCAIYQDRIGIHKTKGGKLFRCVSIREVLNDSWPGDWNCAYKHRR